MLAHPSDLISIAQIVEVVDHTSELDDEDWFEESGFNGFLDRFLWNRLNEQMLHYLQGVTLGDLLNQHDEAVKLYAMSKSANAQKYPSPLLSVMRLAC